MIVTNLFLMVSCLWTGRYDEVLLSEYSNSNAEHIGVSYYTGNIYFVTINSGVGMIDKRTKNVEEMYSREKVQALAVDNYIGSQVYIGCASGLKIYNEITGSITDVAGITYDISNLFVSKIHPELYIKTLGNEVYKYTNPVAHEEKVDVDIATTELNVNRGFVVDSANNFYVVSSETPNKIQTIQASSTQHEARVEYTADDDLNFWCLAADNEGNVYAAADLALYRLHPNNNIPELVTKLSFAPRAMSFDRSNDIVFVTKDDFIVLLKHNFGCR